MFADSETLYFGYLSPILVDWMHVYIIVYLGSNPSLMYAFLKMTNNEYLVYVKVIF